MSYANKKKKLTKSTLKTSYLNILPIILVLSILPLVFRLKFITYPVERLTWYTTNAMLPNLYTYYKASMLIFAALIGIVILGYRLITHTMKYPNKKSFYFLYAYIVIVIISWIFSVDIFFSTSGFIDHHESGFVLISYIIMFIYTAVLLRTEQEFKLVIYCWIGSIFILFFVGLTQFFGHDITFSSFMKPFIIPAQYINAFELQRQIADKFIQQTLFHFNYVSFYTAIAFPFFAVLLLLDKVKSHRIVYSLILLMMIFNLVASGSRNGLIGIIAALVVILIVVRKSFSKRYKYLLLSVIGATALFVVVNIVANTILAQKFMQLTSQLTDTVDYPLNSIHTYADKVVIDHDQFDLQIKYQSDNAIPFTFYNEKDELLNLVPHNDTFVIGSPTGEPLGPYAPLSITMGQYEESPIAMMNIDSVDWGFSYKDNQFYYINSLGLLESLKDIPSIGFEGMERLGSARGYIWSRTLPLLKDYWLLGSGPDTYPIVFPQTDYVGKYNAYRDKSMVVDKPHNFLLGYAVNTGIASLILLLIFWGIYIVWCLRLFVKSNLESIYAKIGMAAFAAVIGYLFAALFNDTNVNITPLFWVILGIGFAANMKVEAETQVVK